MDLTVESAAFAIDSPRLSEVVSISTRPVVAVPRWTLTLEAIHASTRSWAAIIADLIIVSLTGLAIGARVPDAVGFAGATLVALYVAGVYSRRDVLGAQGVLWYPARILRAFGALAVLALAVSRPLGFHEAMVGGLVLAGFAGLVLLRSVTWGVLSATRRRGVGLHPTVVLGNGPGAQVVETKLRTYRQSGLLPVATLPLHAPATLHDLPRALVQHGADHVIFAPEASDGALITACLKRCAGQGVRFAMLPVMADLFLHPGLVSQVGGIPLMPVPGVLEPRPAPGKRVLDITIATLCLLAVAPLMALTAVAIKLSDRGPVFYRQRRVGRGGTTFRMIKFRSMVVDAERMRGDLHDRNITDGLLFKVVDDPRVTPVGRIIRRLSIDELPQLLNVLKGEMSLVGPRPLPVEPGQFGAIDNERHQVLPGITGYWQLSGGPSLTYEEMVKLDLAYIQNWSLWLDLRLLLRTIPALVVRPGPW
jgi:exopolysaccharide biosynthesis polyprenyl glycosylphosphotransferase